MNRHFFAVALFACLILFLNLPRGDLSGYDDAVYAHQAKEMLRSGDWWNVRFNGWLNFEYPPMFMWLEAVSMMLWGATDFAAKFPVALLGLGTILATWYISLELTSDRWLALISSVVLTSTQPFMKYATHAMTDVPSAFFTTLAMLAYLKGLRNRNYFVVCGLLLACAIFTRSVVGALPLGIFFSHAIISKRYDVLRSPQAIAGLMLAVAVPATWFVSQYYLHGQVFATVHLAFIENKISSIQSPSVWHRFMGILVYPKLLLQGYWPWLPLLLIGVTRQTRTMLLTRDSSATFLILWAAWILVPFSLAEAKILRYIIPVFPCFAVLAAMPLNQWLSGPQKEKGIRVVYGLGTAVVVFMFFFPMTLLRGTDMKQLAPIAETHAAPEQRIVFYTGGRTDWQFEHQFLWYGNRYSDFMMNIDEVMKRLAAAPQVVIMDSPSFDQAFSAIDSLATITVLARSENFICFRSSPKVTPH